MTSPDVVIVGGGVIGASIAWRLAQQGQRVALLDQGEPGAEASSAAAGILSPQAEADAATAFFDLTVASRRLYPEFARELLEATGVDVELRLDGVLAVATTERELEDLNARVLWQSRAGQRIERLTAPEVANLESGIRGGLAGGVFFPDDGQVENVRLIRAVLLAATRAGVRIEGGTPVRRILERGGRVYGVETSTEVISAPQIVLAAGAWSGQSLGLTFEVPVLPARGEMVAVRSHRPPRYVLFSPAVYVVPRRDGRVLFGATLERAGFDKRVKAQSMAKLLAAGVELLPALGEAGFDSAWAGLRPAAPDNLPLLGPTPLQGLTLATGHFRNGILLAPITAKLISTLVTTGSAGFDLSPFALARFRS